MTEDDDFIVKALEQLVVKMEIDLKLALGSEAFFLVHWGLSFHFSKLWFIFRKPFDCCFRVSYGSSKSSEERSSCKEVWPELRSRSDLVFSGRKNNISKCFQTPLKEELRKQAEKLSHSAEKELCTKKSEDSTVPNLQK